MPECNSCQVDKGHINFLTFDSSYEPQELQLTFNFLQGLFPCPSDLLRHLGSSNLAIIDSGHHSFR